MVNVVHNTSGENDYANVASVSPIPGKWKDRVPPMVNKPVYFETEMGPGKEFQALPDFLQKMIEKCHEWAGQGSSVSAAADDSDDPFAGDEDEQTEKVNAEAQAASKRIQPEDDDIPF